MSPVLPQSERDNPTAVLWRSQSGVTTCRSPNVLAASPSTVYRVLFKAGILDRWNRQPSKKGTGFVQPLRPHEHWHIDVAYLNIGGTFYYLCSVLDGASRSVAVVVATGKLARP